LVSQKKPAQAGFFMCMGVLLRCWFKKTQKTNPGVVSNGLMNGSFRPIPDAHRNRMNHAEKWKADFQFRRKQSLILEAKQLKAGGQTEMRIYLAVRLLGSGWG
jgi:hypothetical protein